MKIFPVLLATALAAQAVPSDPGTAAIDFLEKVRLGKLNLEPGGDTALSPQTAASKKHKIAKSLDRMANDLGSDPLEVGAVKLDGGFAAVLVRKIGGFDPNRLQVFPVALVERGGEWSPAPVPASFENSGAGYALELRKRLELLEDWMLRERVVDLEQLREQSAARMREKIERTLPVGMLRSMSASQCSTRFLAACEKGDLPSMLGFLGGLSANLPGDWPMRLKAVERAVAAGTSTPRPWRLLTSPEVARAVVANNSEGTGAFISIGCLDPAGTAQGLPRIELIHFEIAKTDDGLWQVNLPSPFFHTAKEKDAVHDDEDLEEDFDADLLDAFPAAWIQVNPLKPQPNADQAHQALISALRSGRFPELLAISKINGESGASARKACIEAAKTGWFVQDPAAVRHALPLAFKEDETAAVGIFQFFSARDPDRSELRALYFEKSETGWFWSPAPSVEIKKPFEIWVDSESQKWRDQWQQVILAGSETLNGIDTLVSPSKEASQLLVEKWLHASREGDVKATLDFVTRLDDPKSDSKLLQNLGYEITVSRRSTVKPVVTGVYQGDTWTAVGVKVELAGKTSHPFYPILQTTQGPRILMEIDLFASESRSREFLNRAAFERLRKSTSTVTELQELFAKHQNHVESLRAKSEH